MAIAKKTFKIVGIVILLLMVIFLAGRFGWKVFGFRACQSAEIKSVEVTTETVRLSGGNPGFFPKGYCGCCFREEDGRLYVGFRFSTVFGVFETGDFDVTIPVKGEIREVILKTNMREDTIWNRETGFVPQSEQYGVYVRLECEDVAAVTMSYEGFDGGGLPADGGVWENGRYIFMDNDIMMVAKDAETPVYFSVTVRRTDGSVLAFGEFQFDADKEKMFLTVTSGGRIEEDRTAYE